VTSVPPSDRDAERAVLGAALVGSQQVHDAGDVLAPRDFYSPQHEAIWAAILEVAGSSQPVDPVTVSARLGNELQRWGGPLILAELTSADVSPNPSALMHYAERVLDLALRRRLIDAGTKVQQMATVYEDATDAAEAARQTIDDAASQARTAEGGATVGEALDTAIDWLENPPLGAATPWVDVNEKTNGMHDGQMIVVAGRPGHGKSLVLKDVAVVTAMQGRPVHVATLEMSRNEYMARIIAGLGRIDLGRMLSRNMSEGDWAKVADAAERARDLPLYLDDRPGQSMAQVRAAARQTARRYGKPLGLVGIDYAQLVRPADQRLPREQQVSQISRDTKLMAKELHCPVMLLAQLNRGNTQRTDHTPVVSDLRESGSLEQDADQVWLLHRPDQYGGDASEDRLGEVDLIVGKNRNGPFPVAVPLAFQGHYGRIVSLA
jgi:replicative DNA helicase